MKRKFVAFFYLALVMISLSRCTPDPYLSADQTNITFPAEGGTEVITLTTNWLWTVTASDSWITVSPQSGDNFAPTFSITVGQNLSYGEKTGTVTISADNVVVTIEITQTQNNDIIIHDKEFEISSKGGVISVDIMSNVAYTVKSECDWITQTKALQSKSLAFNVAENPNQYSTRVGKISFTSGAITDTIFVTQIQDNAIFIDNTQFSLATEGGNIEVEVNSNVDYTITIPSGSDTWIKNITTKALTNNILQFQILKNTTFDNREGTVIIRNNTLNLGDTLKISQEQTDTIYLTDNDITVNGDAQLLDLTVNSNLEYSIEMLGNISDWVSIVETKGITSNTIQLSIDFFQGSDTEFYRTGQIVFKNTAKYISDTLNLRQDANGVFFINSQKQGDLATQISTDDYLKVKKLILSGIISNTDISTIKTNFLSLEYLDISGTNLTVIPYSAFSTNGIGMINLSTVILPDNLTDIYTSAFTNCQRLSSINFPANLKSIGNNSFSGCTSIINIEIGSSVTSIGASAFLDCTSLKSINIPKNVTRIELQTFKNCIALESINLSSKTVYIGNYAFQNCIALTEALTPDALTEIGLYSFSGCTSLTSVILSKNLTKFGNGVFDGCTALQSINIPVNITTLTAALFNNCSSLTNITCYPVNPPSAAYNSFYGVDKTKCTLIVPSSSLTLYQESTIWKDFIIQAAQ
ncbi:MAG: leucine-rich repeat protein [Bacteroidales bacterium]|jgi:hypothetical protein